MADIETISADQYNDLMTGKGKPRKYHNEPIEVDGIRFDSIAESTRYRELTHLLNAGEITCLELQVTYPLMVQGVRIASYIADFRYLDIDGDVVVEDVKGVRTAVYKLKKKHLKAQYGIEIVEVSV